MISVQNSISFFRWRWLWTVPKDNVLPMLHQKMGEVISWLFVIHANATYISQIFQPKPKRKPHSNNNILRRSYVWNRGVVNIFFSVRGLFYFHINPSTYHIDWGVFFSKCKLLLAPILTPRATISSRGLSGNPPHQKGGRLNCPYVNANLSLKGVYWD